MKSRPILFSAPMVRALLDGSKTQTRRVCKPAANLSEVVGIQDPSELEQRPIYIKGSGWFGDAEGYVQFFCPYGQVGDQLWVREAFCDATDGLHGRVLYRATGDTACKWKPSIHMFRHQSRITLEITNVRVERLQDISEADALSEGIIQADDGGYHLADTRHYSDDPVESYASLWESINGEGSWDANP